MKVKELDKLFLDINKTTTFSWSWYFHEYMAGIVVRGYHNEKKQVVRFMLSESNKNLTNNIVKHIIKFEKLQNSKLIKVLS